jgi:hypothetical protein
MSEVSIEMFEALKQTVESLQSDKEQLEGRVSELESEKDDLQEQVDQKDKRIGELEQKVSDLSEQSAKDRASIKKRLTNVEESTEEPDSSDANHGGSTSGTTLQEPETPLEDIVQLPEHVVDESLSANQQRSRFVAKDVNQYSRSVPAGRAIKSSELRRVLSARDDGSCHTQTVQRVMERLDDLGGDDVAVKETQDGQKVVVFTDEIVQRIQRYNQSHTVVSQQEAST